MTAAKNVLVKAAFELQSSRVFEKRSKGYREKSSAGGTRSRVFARLNLLSPLKKKCLLTDNRTTSEDNEI